TSIRPVQAPKLPAAHVETGAVVVPDAAAERSGAALDRGTRAFMEARFAYDFSRVRVHHDAAAASSAAQHDAEAYTIGRDIYFGADRYRPDSETGRRLLAHELAHTIQQESAQQPSTTSLQRMPADSAAEVAAHDAAGRVMRGQGAPVLSATAAGIARQPKRAAPATSGHLAFDSNWSYI